ncbi:copper-binding protein [Magnetococcales bacterium HHB-1]
MANRFLPMAAVSLFFMLSVSSQAISGEKEHQHHMHGSQQHAGHVQATGVIEAVDLKKGKVTIIHEPIEALGWPTMKMDFSVQPGIPLNGFRKGQKVAFHLKEAGSYGYTVTHMVPAMPMQHGQHDSHNNQQNNGHMHHGH